MKTCFFQDGFESNIFEGGRFDGDGIGCWQRHIPSNLSVTLFQQMYKSRGQRISIVASVKNFNHTIEASLIF